MPFETELHSKDSIKLNFLKGILDNKVLMNIQLDGQPKEDYASQIHNDNSRIALKGKFNLTEDPSRESLLIRPVSVYGGLILSFLHKQTITNGIITVTQRVGGNKEIKDIPFNANVSQIEFIPKDNKTYLLKINTDTDVIIKETTTTQSESKPPKKENASGNQSDSRFEADNGLVDGSKQTSYFDERFDSGNGFQEINRSSHDDNRFDFDSHEFDNHQQDDNTNNSNNQAEQRNTDIQNIETTDNELSRIENDIRVLEQKQTELTVKKQKAIEHLEKIEAEYNKDYNMLEQELNDIKSRMEADKAIIDFYQDQDVVPIESIFSEVSLRLEEAEKQIKMFIEAKQNKTREIEQEIKSNKR